MNKVLVTGGAGFIGTNLIKQLLNDKLEVFSLDNYSTGTKKNEQFNVKYIDGDIEDISSIVDQNFDICFHLAAQSRVQPSFSNPEDSFRVNVNGTLKVMEWAKNNKLKLFMQALHQDIMIHLTLHMQCLNLLVKKYVNLYKILLK